MIGLVAVVLVVSVGAVIYYLNRPAAQEASIDNALTALEDATPDMTGGSSVAATADATGSENPPSADVAATEEVASTGGAADAPEDVSGTWTVNTDIGDFDFADATSTFAGFRVEEELNNVGQTEAIGRTPVVTGELEIDGTTLSDARIVADFTQMTSDIPRRENAMRRAMGVAENPLGTFSLIDPVDFDQIPAEGQTITFAAVGDLTVNGITNQTTFDMEAQVADGNILVVGQAPVVFADYDISAPQAGPVVSIQDNGTIELQVWFSRAG